MKRTAIFFFSCLIIILAIYKIKINAAGGYYAPQGFTAPTIISAQNDYNGEIDIKWLNMSSSNDTQTGVYQSWLIYYVYRKADADFTALDTQVIMSEGILVDTVSQIVNDGHPQTFTYWSDTSVKINNQRYYYSIIAFDRYDLTYSSASNTTAITCDTEGPILKYLASNVPGHLEYIKKDNVQITVVVYENNQLVSSNIRLNYGFCSDTNNISNLNNIDSVGMIVTNAETQNYYYVSGVLPVSNAGADTVVVYWFTGTDNAQGLTDEPQDLTSDGNLLTSQISGRLLLDNATAAIVYIDAISPMLQNIISPDSYSGYISGADTNVIISVVDDMYIETGNFILNYKKVGDANINSILMNYSGTPYSGQFSAVLPLSQFSNNDIIKYWVTGRDKAGNIVGAMTFISEATARALIVDTASPQVLNFQILNAINNLEDSTYSTNTFADSIVYFYLNVADSVEIDTIYMKLYSQENNQDSTNYIVGANTIYFNVIDDTTLRTDTITFINNGNVYPVIYLSDTIGNVNIYAVAQYAGATQIYPLISKIIKINSDSTQIINIEHINNDVAIRNTELNAGDSLVITFNNSIDTSTITAFELAIVNENGATLGTITDYIWQQDFTKLIFTIPSDYAFQNYDTFGLEVFVRDLYGNYADTIASAIIDMAGPVLTNIVFVNNDTTAAYSTTITAGDSVILFFSEAMDTAILPSGAIANLQNYIKINFASVKNFGTTAYIQWIDSKTLSIGLGANVSLQDGDTLSLSYLMKDIYGNCADTDINAIYNVVIFDTAGPTIVRAYLDTVYDSTGRTINVLFSEPVKTEDLLISNFSSSLNITDVLAQIDTDKCYIRFLNIVSPGIDTIAISSSAVLSDRSILNNSATDFTPKQIIDLDSPYIKNIYVLNNDTNAGNTQISAGDTLVIVFSEPMDFRYLTKSVFMDSFSISGRTTPDTYGANFEFAVYNDSKELHILLGTSVSIIDGDTINPSQYVADLSGNPDVTADTMRIRDTFGPILVDYFVLNNDTSQNSILSVGDTIIFYFSEPIDTSLIIGNNANNLFLVNGQLLTKFGSVSNWRYDVYGNTVAITLTSGFTIQYSDTFALNPAIFRDIYENTALTGYYITLRDSIPPYIINCYFQNNDTSYTTFSQYDYLFLKFSEPMDTSILALGNVSFGAASSDLGAGASAQYIDSVTIRITLGSNPLLFSGDTIFISGLKDQNNNEVVNLLNKIFNDTEPAIILSVVFTDADSSSNFSAGDTFTIVFSEPMDTTLFPNGIYANLNDTITTIGRNLGVNIPIQWLSDTTLNIGIGSSFTIRHNDIFTFNNVIKDANSVSYTQIDQTGRYGTFKDTAGPYINKVELDVYNDSYCRLVNIYFNVAVDTVNTAIDTANYQISGNSVISATALNSTTIMLRVLNPINASISALTASANILDEYLSANQSLVAQNIVDTVPVSILNAYINTNNDTTNRTIDIYFNKAVNTAYAGNSAYYNNVSINNITFTDSTVARLFLNNQLKPSSDTIGISKYIRDFSDSNILNDTVSVTPIDTTRPYLTRIQVINNDANTDITSGDTLALYFSESINTATVNVNNVKTILGVNLGDTTAIDIYWGYYNTIMYVKIGTNPSIIYPSYINPQDTVVFTDYSANQDSTLSELLIPDNYPPDAPTNVIMQDTDLPYANAGYDNDNAINIWWTAPIATDVDSYAVYISTNNGQYALVDYTANTYYNYTNLNYHYSYKAVVRAIDRAGNYSDTSNATASIISDTYATRPNAPQPTDANYNINFDTDNVINWQWTTSDTDIDYYMVYVDSGYGFVYYDTTNVNEIQLTGTYRNTYRLRVQAVDFAGNISDTSLASIYVTVDTGDVSSPNNIIHTDNANPGYDNDTALYFTWAASPDTDFGFFSMWYKFDNNPFVYIGTTTNNYYTLNVSNPGTYILRVYASDSAGNISPDSAISAAVIVDTFVAPVNLTQPLDGLTNQVSNIFSWTHSADANTYILQISATNFASFVVNTEYPADTNLINITLDSGTYRWRVISKDNAGNTAVSNPAYSTITIDTFVCPPNIMYPVNNYDTNNHYPTFSWNLTDADTYIWYFGKQIGGVFNVIDSNVFTRSTTATNLSQRMENDTYYWFIVVQDSAGNINVSDTYQLILSGVDYFSSLYPANNTDTKNRMPYFEWQAAIGANEYYIVYSKNSNFAVSYNSTTTANTYITLNLAQVNTTPLGDRIYWYVVGRDVLGNTNTTEIRNIFIDGFAVEPDTRLPINDTLTRNTLMQFSWARPIDSIKYELYICTDVTFATAIRSIEITDSRVLFYDTQLLEEGEYYWYLKVYDVFNNETATAIRKITIDYTVGKPTLIEPQNNLCSTDRSPILRWAHVSDASHYTLQVSSDSMFNNILISFDTPYLLYTIITPLEDGKYYWRVIANDTALNTNASDTFIYIVDNIAPQIRLTSDSMIISGAGYTGIVIEKNIDTGYVVVNNETAYLSFQQMSDTYYLFTVDLNTITGINNVYLYVADSVGFSANTTFVLYQGAQLLNYNPSAANVFSLLADSREILITSSAKDMQMQLALNRLSGQNDTISLNINLDNSANTPVLILIESLADSNLSYDTRFVQRLNETKNTIMSIKIFDIFGNQIQSDASKIQNAFIEFEIDKNLLASAPSIRSFGIYTVSRNRWYEINDIDIDGGAKLIGDYIYTDTSIRARVNRFSIYAAVLESAPYTNNIENIVIYPNPYVPNDGNNLTGRPANEYNGGIFFGIDNNNDGTIDYALPVDAEITIYTLLGERVAIVKRQANGMLVWDAKDSSGSDCASGLYLALIKYNGQKIIKKIAIVR